MKIWSRFTNLLSPFVFYVVVFVCSFGGCNESSQAPTSEVITTASGKQSSQGMFNPQRASQDLDIRPEKFIFSLESAVYAIDSHGEGLRNRPGNAEEQFSIGIGEGELKREVDAPMFFFKFEESPILIYGLYDDESGWGCIARLNSSLKAKWTTYIPSFNLGDSLVENHFIYLSALGFVAKLDLSSGQYAWQHNNLYTNCQDYSRPSTECGRFNSFDAPQIEGDTILFPETRPYREKNQPKLDPLVIRLDKNTGKILEKRTKVAGTFSRVRQG